MSSSQYTAITAVRNGENFLNECLRSVINQSLPPLRYLIIDDHSTDETSKIAKEHALEVHTAWGFGQFAAINQAISLVKTEYIAFLDHDDVWASEKNQIQMDLLQSDQNLDCVFGGVINFFPDGTPEINLGPSRLLSASLFTTRAFERVGPFDQSLENSSIIDWWMRASRLGLNVAQCKDTVLRRRIHSANKGIVTKERSQSEIFTLLRKASKNE